MNQRWIAPLLLSIVVLLGVIAFQVSRPSPTELLIENATGVELPSSQREWDNATRRAHLSATKADLKSLASAQEMYHAGHGVYAETLSELGFAPSADVTVVVVEATRDGWWATGAHRDLAEGSCAIFAGTVSGVPITMGAREATREMVPTCDDGN